jgi:hypothetical protein
MPIITLKKKIDAIIELQPEKAFILTGFYLKPDDINALNPELESDIPPTGAVGRYRGIPVFQISGAAADTDGLMYRTTFDIRYSFVKMDVVN